jgi:hypothetical protein
LKNRRLESIPSADTNSDSDSNRIDTGIDASGIVDQPARSHWEMVSDVLVVEPVLSIRNELGNKRLQCQHSAGVRCCCHPSFMRGADAC